MDPAKYAELFLAESREHLTTLNQHLLAWEQEPEATEPVGTIFRAIHTIKGMAATMGYMAVADIAHRAENLLDLLRVIRGAVPSETLELLFEVADVLEVAVEQSVLGKEGLVDATDLLARLDQTAITLEPAAGRAPAERPSVPSPAAPVSGGRGITVEIRPAAPLKGVRALLVLRRMETLGKVFGIRPPLASLEGEGFDGMLAFRIDSDAPDALIESEIRAAGDVESVSVASGPEVQGESEAVGKTRHLRVSLRRIDNLMSLIGELVTARSRLAELTADRADPDLEDVAMRITHLTGALQGEIIQARMTPVWHVFDRFPRLVRDVARQLDKRVSFHIEGKEIELDRAILDEIGDPLVHLLRNAVDHGIEPPGEREAAGKSPEGRIVLSAARDGSTVVIRVNDDGRGIDRDRVLRDAKRAGIVDEDVDQLADDLLVRVLAHAGYSTAEQVSEVSGRGVGIDVVVTHLQAFGGSLDIQTEVGSGSTFTLRLPPTLAILPALLTRVGEEQYALPLTHVEETVDLDTNAVTEMNGSEAMLLRDQVIPLVRLRGLVGITGDVPGHPPVIVLQIGDRRTGLVVDGLLGQREIVVKGFDAPVGTLPIFSGATILGDGRPVLILDAARIA